MNWKESKVIFVPADTATASLWNKIRFVTAAANLPCVRADSTVLYRAQHAACGKVCCHTVKKNYWNK